MGASSNSADPDQMPQKNASSNKVMHLLLTELTFFLNLKGKRIHYSCEGEMPIGVPRDDFSLSHPHTHDIFFYCVCEQQRLCVNAQTAQTRLSIRCSTL